MVAEAGIQATAPVYRPGLEGVPATQSAVCDIDGQQGILSYRGYRVEDLAAQSTFLETTYLLIWGELPDAEQLAAFEQEVQMHRRVSFRIRDMMKSFPSQGHPMDALQASAASLGLFYSRRALDNPEYIYGAVVRLIAKIPTMVAAFQLIRKGQDPIQPRDDLAYASNFLYMLTEQEPDPLAARIFDACLILHAEHSLNASTFSARVTASTLTDPYAVVASAVGTLAGPLHGGANEDVLEMLEEIGSEDQVEPWLDRAIAEKRKIMGFGHREYKVKDPRAVILQKLAEQLFDSFGHDPSTTWPASWRPPLPSGSVPGHLSQRGFLFRPGVSQARHPRRPVHTDLRHRPHRRLAGPLEGAARCQPHLPAHADLHRLSVPRADADRGPLTRPAPSDPHRPVCRCGRLSCPQSRQSPCSHPHADHSSQRHGRRPAGPCPGDARPRPGGQLHRRA